MCAKRSGTSSARLTNIETNKLKTNPGNPRVIRKDKLKKLVQSLKDFPEMLEARPIVVDPDYMVLGGNMRLQAALQAGLTEVPVYIASWEEAKQKQFIIKDNVPFGEWDWDVLANEWEAEELTEWGLDVPVINEKLELDEQEVEFSEYLDESHNYVVLLFENDIDWLSAQTHFELKSVYSKRQNGKPWSKGIGRVINGAQYLNKLKGE